MSFTPPVPPSAEEARTLALAVIQRAKFPMLATVESDTLQPRLRPISPLRVVEFTVYFANLRKYGKTHELAANPQVELCYLDAEHCQVRITGTAEEISAPMERQSLWDASPLLRKYMGSIENPQLMFYRVRPSRVRFMQEWALDYAEVPLA